MTDLQPYKPDRFRFTKEWGLTFIAIIFQIIAFSFGAGMIYFRLDANVTKTELLSAKVDIMQQATNDKFNHLSTFIAEAKVSYDAIKDRLVRVENKIDGSAKN